MRDELEQRYARGDHREARRLARALLAGEGDPEAATAARRILAHTEPDAFLTWLGALGLGLTAWLVYKYVL